MLGLPKFLKFYWVTLNYTLSISHSPRALASGGQSNVKFIESPLVYAILSSLYRSPEIKSKRKKFKLFINYLVKYYLAPSAKFPFRIWNYFSSITEDVDMAVTTNSLENVNLKLKRHLGHGYLSEKNAYRKLKSFQEAQIALYYIIYIIYIHRLCYSNIVYMQ